MLTINNVLIPCILCGQPVFRQGGSFCPSCNIFTNKKKLIATVENSGFTVEPEHTHTEDAHNECLVFFDEE